jgi:hypothetical protein
VSKFAKNGISCSYSLNTTSKNERVQGTGLGTLCSCDYRRLYLCQGFAAADSQVFSIELLCDFVVTFRPRQSGARNVQEHWAARRIELNYWRYPAKAASIGPEHAIRHVRKLIPIAPDIALVVLGRLLYPHIG